MPANGDRSRALYRAIQLTSGIIDELFAELFPDRETTRESFWETNVHHYTDLNAARLLIESGNVWLTDARYCNDWREIELAADIIRRVFDEILGTGAVQALGMSAITLSSREDRELRRGRDDYWTRLQNFAAYICCLCAGDSRRLPHPQDLLSQWRAYGSNGRGACISFGAGEIEWAINKHYAPGTIFNRSHPPDRRHRLDGWLFEPVLYEDAHQKAVIRRLVYDAVTDGSASGTINIGHLVDALLMVTPLMKHRGFSEEREWRLVLLPDFLTLPGLPAGALPPDLPYFRPRPDLLVPYVDIKSALQRRLTVLQVMIGPSNIPELNEKAIERVQGAPRPILKSEIPYRV
jgi:hypothetical protein